MPYTYEEYLHNLKGSKMTENDLKELFDREKLRDEKFHNLIEENEILMGKLKTANKYKYEKCIDCIHAHMDKDGNHDCGFMDCVSEQDKEYPDDTLGISDIHKYSHRLFDAFNKLEFRTTFSKSLQAFYLERGLYVIRAHVNGKYQFTLVEASSEEMAIRKCI